MSKRKHKDGEDGESVQNKPVKKPKVGEEVEYKLIELLLSLSGNAVTGAANVKRLAKVPLPEPCDHTVFVFTRDVVATLQQCKMVRHLYDLVDVEWKIKDYGYEVDVYKYSSKVDKQPSGFKVCIIGFERKKDFYRIDCGASHLFVQSTKFGSRVINTNGLFDRINSSDVFDEVISDCRAGYTKVIRCEKNLKDRMEEYKIMISQGLTPVRWSGHGIERHPTILTTIDAIKKFEPQIYENYIVDNKCPVTFQLFSEMEDKRVFLLSSDRVIGFDYGSNMVSREDFNGLCPITKKLLV